MEWLPPLGLKGDLRSWIHVRFHSYEDRLDCAVQMAPLTDLAKRREIVTKLFEAYPRFGFKLPKAAAKEVKNNRSGIMTTEHILEWDEDDDPDSEAIRERIRVAVKKTLDDLYPKLEKLALVLKPLCKPSPSRT